MARHFLTLYSLKYTAGRTDRPLGNIDGQGTRLVRVFDEILRGVAAHHDQATETVLRFEDQKAHPGTPIVTYTFKHGEYGTDFEVTPAIDLDQVNYNAAANESRTVILAAAVVAPFNRTQGWLVTHSIGRNISMAGDLKSVLLQGFRDRRNQYEGTLHIDPAHLAEAWELMLREGAISGLMLHVPRRNVGDDDLFQEIDLEELGEVRIDIRPFRGLRFKRQAANAIRRLVQDDDLVVFRGNGVRADSATIEVEFRGSKRRLDIQVDEVPMKIPRLEATTAPPNDDTRHEWIAGETTQLLQLLNQTV